MDSIQLRHIKAKFLALIEDAVPLRGGSIVLVGVRPSFPAMSRSSVIERRGARSIFELRPPLWSVGQTGEIRCQDISER
jgi:hypothetical protein